MFMRKTSVQIYELSSMTYVTNSTKSKQPDLPRPIFLMHTQHINHVHIVKILIIVIIIVHPRDSFLIFHMSK
jgi:hypothetical protein